MASLLSVGDNRPLALADGAGNPVFYIVRFQVWLTKRFKGADEIS